MSQQDPFQQHPSPQYPSPQYPSPQQPGQPLDSRYPQSGGQHPGAAGTDGDFGSRYGTVPYGQGVNFGAPPQRPALFDRLLQLTLVSGALTLLSGILTMIFRPSEATLRELILDSYQAGGPAPTEADLDQILPFVQNILTGSLIVSLILTVGLYLLVYLPLRRGRNWARILGIVFAILGTLSTAAGFTQVGALGETMWIIMVVGILLAVVNVLWLILAFNPKVADYTRAVSAPGMR